MNCRNNELDILRYPSGKALGIDCRWLAYLRWHGIIPRNPVGE